jgi:hypothetical protein
MKRRQADEIVFGNSWQDEYYFRRLGSAFHVGGDGLCETHGRFWFVWTEDGPKPDDALASARLLGGGRILCRRDFPGTTVFLCERRQAN